MLLTMEEIKAQLRLDEDFDTDDRHLQLLACAAQKRTETYLNRKLYAPDETIPDSDPDGLHLPDDIRLGMLMLISHFYENRSSVTDSSGDTVDAINSAQWGAGAYDAYGTGIPARGYTPYPAVDPAQSNNASDVTGPNPFMINKASAPKVDGEIKVSFVNSPPGMRVMETRSSGFDVSHDVGYTRFGR